MARVPLSLVPNEPIPGAPPEDYQRIQSSPADFGGLIGQAADRVGQQGQQASDKLTGSAELIQSRFNEVAADDQTNQFITNADKLLNGDPTNSDPVKKAGLLNLRGQDALNAAPQIQSQLQQLREDQKNNLQNPAQQLYFDQSTRRYLEYRQGSISAHLDQQGNVYAEGVARAQQNLAASTVDYSSDTDIMTHLQNSRSGAIKVAQIKYGNAAGKDVTDSAIMESDSIVLRSAIERALTPDQNGVAHPERAAAILQKFGHFMEPSIAEAMGRATKGAADEVGVAAGIDDAFSGRVASGAAPSGAPTAAPLDTGTRQRAQVVHDEVVRQGGTDAEGWGWAANGVHESGANPAPVPGDGGISHGMFQLNKDQLAAYQATHNGHLPEQDDMATQLAFARGRAAIPGAPQTPDQWAKAISINFEVPKGGAGEAANRGATATALSGAPLPDVQKASATPAPAGAPGPTQAAASQHNPAAFGTEQQIMDNAYASARQRFPDNPARQNQIVDGVWQKLQRNNLLQSKWEADQAKARQDAQEGILNNAITTLNKDPTKFDPSVLDVKDATGNYVLTPAQREGFDGVVKRKLAERGIEDTAPYGPGYAKAYNDILAPSNAPNKINTLADIMTRAAPGGDLTSIGAERLTKVFVESHKSPDENALAKTEAALLTYAQRRLTFPDVTVAPNMQITDRTGQDIFNSQFVPEFERRLTAAKATGNQADIDKVLNKDSIDQMARGMRSQADIDRARMEATGQLAPGDVEKPGTPIPPPPNPRDWVKDFPLTTAPGMVAPGNLDPWNRPVLHNPDGSYSTTSSMSIGTDKGETVIPTVVNGKRLSNDEAIAHFRQTGENFGTFGTPAQADDFATKLHNAQASQYDEKGNPRSINPDGWATVMARPPNATGGMPYTHALWAQALSLLLKDPSPKAIQQFDAVLGPQSYSGAQIVKALTTPAAAPLPATDEFGSGGPAPAAGTPAPAAPATTPPRTGPYTLESIGGGGAYRGRFKLTDAAGHDIGFTGSHDEAQAEVARLNAQRAGGWNLHLPDLGLRMHHTPGVMSGLPADQTNP